MLLLFAACSKDDDHKNEPLPKGRRTVIVYMSGRNTLSSFTNNDFQELVNGSKDYLQGNDRLVVFLSRVSTKEKQAIIRITGNSNQPVDTLYKYPTSFYSSEPDQFVEVLERTMKLCPAEEYALVLWGHASGWNFEQDTRRAYGIDNGNTSVYSNDGLWLNLPDMRSCFEKLGVKWKFIFADCCNMMGAEVAYELRNHADYLIGSPAEIPGYGAPYDKILPYFFSQADNFYEGIVDTYASAYPEYLPLSAIRLSEMESLAAATRQVLPAVADHLRQGDNVATKGIIYYFSPGGRKDDVNKVMYDMNDMIRTALTDNTEAYNTWHEAYNKAVPKRVIAEMWETLHYNTVNFDDFIVTDEKMGSVNMFFPLDKYNKPSCLHPYNTDIKQMQWYNAVGWQTVGY